jgi:hypothetical protein
MIAIAAGLMGLLAGLFGMQMADLSTEQPLNDVSQSLADDFSVEISAPTPQNLPSEQPDPAWEQSGSPVIGPMTPEQYFEYRRIPSNLSANQEIRWQRLDEFRRQSSEPTENYNRGVGMTSDALSILNTVQEGGGRPTVPDSLGIVEHNINTGVAARIQDEMVQNNPAINVNLPADQFITAANPSLPANSPNASVEPAQTDEFAVLSSEPTPQIGPSNAEMGSQTSDGGFSGDE